ncbi:MAG: TIGR04283 family arsenosugar biosynthesis glycosyltransferase [Desulfobacter sp.]|nr:MAG: TIGR04283 family arsenosugar biosynthesis glycosyltransferase [Desulfobacter sp.]
MQVSIIIPVYREQDNITDTLAIISNQFKAMDHEILVVDGEPGASTRSFLKSRHLPGDTIRLLSASQGRGRQMNAGAKAAKGDLFLFIHADSHPQAGGIEKMVEQWHTRPSDMFCGAFDLAIDSGKPIFRVIERTASLRSRLTRIPYGDQGIFMSRALFERVGGFPDRPLMEDVGLMSAVKKAGIKPVFIPRKMLTSARRWETKGVAWVTLSNWMFITLYGLGVSPEKLARMYYR